MVSASHAGSRYYFDRQENLTKLLQRLAHDAPQNQVDDLVRHRLRETFIAGRHERRAMRRVRAVIGRPRGRHKEAPYETVLGQRVTIREDGVERHVKADEAFLLQHTKRALEGDGAATRTTLAVIEYAKERLSTDHGFIRTIVRVMVDPGSVTHLH